MHNKNHNQAAYLTRKDALIKDAMTLICQGHALALAKKTSNLFRNRQTPKHRLDVSNFNHVIDVNLEDGYVEAEAMTTFEALVDATLSFGYLPAVVPELKSITVGGGLSGVAIESSSFRYGLVHENIIESEILLSDGRVITCTKDNEHQDLFYGFPNTYGALGYALKLKMKIIKAKPFVKLSHHLFDNPTHYFKKVNDICRDNQYKGPIAFVDGSIFAQDDLSLTLGEFIDNAPYTSNYQWMSIYYRSIKNRKVDYLTTKDYIWRWDTDWFWCSKNFFMQNKVMRFLVGKWLLNSVSFWKMMHFSRNNPIAKWLLSTLMSPTETVIQDIEVPVNNAEQFHRFFHNKIGITPVWMCPVKTVNSTKSYPFYALPHETLFINFGFWDSIKSNQPIGYYNRLIENKVQQLSGHKSLYSDVYYSEKTFWTLYDKPLYDHLKYKYDPKGHLKNWYDKIMVK